MVSIQRERESDIAILLEKYSLKGDCMVWWDLHREPPREGLRFIPSIQDLLLAPFLANCFPFLHPNFLLSAFPGLLCQHKQSSLKANFPSL